MKVLKYLNALTFFLICENRFRWLTKRVQICKDANKCNFIIGISIRPKTKLYTHKDASFEMFITILIFIERCFARRLPNQISRAFYFRNFSCPSFHLSLFLTLSLSHTHTIQM